MKSTSWKEYEVGDMFKIISLTDVMYYKKQTNSNSPGEWRHATGEEVLLFNSGSTNINQIPQTPQYEIY